MNEFMALICKNEDSTAFFREMLGKLNWIFGKLQSSMKIAVLITEIAIFLPEFHFVATELFVCNGKKLHNTCRVKTV